MFYYTSIYFLITGKQIKVILNLVTHRIAHGFLCKFYSTQVSAQSYSHSSQNIIPSGNIPTCEVLFPPSEKKHIQNLWAPWLYPQYNFWPYASTHTSYPSQVSNLSSGNTVHAQRELHTVRRNLGWKSTSLLTFEIKIKMKSFANSTK